METANALKKVGINYDSGMQRFHNNEGLYTKYLFRLPEETLVEEAKVAMDNNDFEKAKMAIHTLKGVLGNLSVDSLFNLTNDLMLKLRSSDFEDAKGLFYQIFLPNYQKVIDVIKEERK